MSWHRQRQQPFLGHGGHNFVGGGYHHPSQYFTNNQAFTSTSSASSISDVTASTRTTASTITASTTSTSNSSSRRKHIKFQISSKNFTDITMADGTRKVKSWQSVVKTDNKKFNSTLARQMCVERILDGYFAAWCDNEEECKRGLEYLEGRKEPTEEDIKSFQTKAQNK
jgi:hypothetical protein